MMPLYLTPFLSNYEHNCLVSLKSVNPNKRKYLLLNEEHVLVVEFDLQSQIRADYNKLHHVLEV